MKEIQVLQFLENQLQALRNSNLIEKNRDGAFENWDHHFTGENGVYILWEDEPDIIEKPLYIGEGIIGNRIWNHYHNKPSWKYLQYISTDDLQNKNLRKLFERYCIVVYEPRNNIN